MPDLQPIMAMPIRIPFLALEEVVNRGTRRAGRHVVTRSVGGGGCIGDVEGVVDERLCVVALFWVGGEIEGGDDVLGSSCSSGSCSLCGRRRGWVMRGGGQCQGSRQEEDGQSDKVAETMSHDVCFFIYFYPWTLVQRQDFQRGKTVITV